MLYGSPGAYSSARPPAAAEPVVQAPVVDEAAQMKAEKARVRHALAHLVNGKLAAAFGTWRDAAGAEKVLRRTCGGAIRRMLNRQLSGGFRGWSSMVLERKQALEDTQRAMRRSLAYLFNRKLSLGWAAWLLLLEQRRSALIGTSAVRRAVNFFVNR